MDFTPRVGLDHREKRTKVLIRSSGSFSMLDDIVAPTPRKISNISCSGSPSVGRREKRKGLEEMLFGEAGFEIQNILLQPREVNLSLSADSVSDLMKPLPITQVLSEEEGIHPKMVTSLRSSNPITLNSPFHFEERNNKPGFESLHQVHQPARLYQPMGRLRNHHFGNGTNQTQSSRKDSRVERSASWPSIPTSPLPKKAGKSS